jgi:uncharacterized protein (DUF2062 family)
VLAPLHHLLLMGIGPRHLAWSLAAGIVIGVNPLIGSTTVFTLVAALLFRLNLIASQIANHVVYPLQFLLLFVFLRAGDLLFHTEPLPFRRRDLLHLAYHPIRTTRLLWHWEWHALIVWALFAMVAAPLIASLLTPALRRLLLTLHQPITED